MASHDPEKRRRIPVTQHLQEREMPVLLIFVLAAVLVASYMAASFIVAFWLWILVGILAIVALFMAGAWATK